MASTRTRTKNRVIPFFLLNQLSLRARIKNYDNFPRSEPVT